MRLKLISSSATTLIWILICFCCCCVFLLSLSHCSTPFLCFYIFVLWVSMNYQLIYLYFIQIEVLSSAHCGTDSNSGREDSSTSTSLEFWSDFHNKLYLNSKLAVSFYFFIVHGALGKTKSFSFWQFLTSQNQNTLIQVIIFICSWYYLILYHQGSAAITLQGFWCLLF